jgi:subtilisin family serine protease
LHATDLRGPAGYNDGYQLVPSDFTDEFSGTGAAACYVGGVAALVASHDPLLWPEEVKRLVTDTATKLPVGGTRRGGARLIAPRAAAQAAVESARKRGRLPHDGSGDSNAPRDEQDE